MKKEFNLSEKREELKEKWLNYKITGLKIFDVIEEQDKEFIRLLKEELNYPLNKDFNERQNAKIDKIAGNLE